MEVPAFKFANGRDPLAFNPSFTLPDDQRPHLSEVSPLDTVPIIDMKESHSSLVKKIAEACEEYGFFQIINHGIPNELCKSMMDAVRQFFHLPVEERAQFVTEDKISDATRIYHSYFSANGKKKVPLWSESLILPTYPGDDFVNQLPQNPPQYREIATEYLDHMVGLIPRILSLISEGLGLKPNSILERTKNTRLGMHAHYIPPCAVPEATLGTLSHTDVNTFTIIQQCEHVVGLQVLKDGKWLAIKPVPNALVINLGDQIQVLSNGKYKSRHHRTVANKDMYRTSIAMFCAADADSIIGPIEDLISAENPPLYRNYLYRDFLAEFRKQENTEVKLKEAFEIKH